MPEQDIHAFEPDDATITALEAAPPQKPPGTAIVAAGMFGDEPEKIIAKATQVANILKDALKKQGLISKIQGKDYPTCEAWTLAGTLLGVFPVCRWTRPIEGGFEARVEAVNLAGVVIGAAEAQCSRDERSWADRDDFAIRSMAQTRATGKCLRMPLGFIMRLAGYEPTPDEDMPGSFTREQRGQMQQDVRDGQARHAAKREDRGPTPPIDNPTYATHADAIRGTAATPANGNGSPQQALPNCPNCDLPLRLSKDKSEYYCWAKKGGCGNTYPTSDPVFKTPVVQFSDEQPKDAAIYNESSAALRIASNDAQLGNMIAELNTKKNLFTPAGWKAIGEVVAECKDKLATRDANDVPF